MTRLARTRVRRWEWDKGKPTAVIGALIEAGPKSVFIPAPKLRRIADHLHDIADQLEEEAGR